ncbi:MAG TPA: hypothetical protein DIC60_00430 [Lachnospiraceae bacterium]|nr:hypothetical protein [Lachnospiraceae bacterium]
MNLYPYNHKIGQKIQTDAIDVAADHAYLAHFQRSATEAIAAAEGTVIGDFATSATVPTVKITGFTNPSCPKNLTVTCGGVDADVKAVQVVIEGTNYADEIISETFPAFTVNAFSTEIGSKAFKTVTKVTVPAMDGAGVTIHVGHGEKLGLPYLLPHNTVIKTVFDNTVEANAPTVTVSATALESNTIDLDSALNSKVVDVYLMV